MVSRENESRNLAEAEAAAWLARLNGPFRSDISEKAFRAWLEADPDHGDAFERATAVWDMLPGVVPEFNTTEIVGRYGDDNADAAEHRQVRYTRRRTVAIAASFVGVLTAGLIYVEQLPPTYQTAVGGQEVVTLDDGTRVTLNTDSRISVRYSPQLRKVTLARGEALFEVTKNPARPFVVFSGDEQVRDIGTKFVVRRDADRTSVTVLEGKVDVARELPSTPEARIASVTAGERVTVAANAPVLLDKPSVDAVTAWRRGEIVFENSRLGDVASEVNRYSAKRLVVADPSLSNLRVSGIFSTGDPGEVATAVAQLYDLKVQNDGDSYRLTRG